MDDQLVIPDGIEMLPKTHVVGELQRLLPEIPRGRLDDAAENILATLRIVAGDELPAGHVPVIAFRDGEPARYASYLASEVQTGDEWRDA